MLGASGLVACDSSDSTSSSGTPAARTTARPGPPSVTASLSGDARITGALTTGANDFVNCEEPSLVGEAIYAFQGTADPAVGTLLTIRDGHIAVRLGSGSGSSYTERDFIGTGVTSFGAASGAQFSSSLTEVTPAAQKKGTIESISSISGSVSCGTFAPGGGTVSVVGDTGNGMISGSLTSIRVVCLAPSSGRTAVVRGLTHVGSTPAIVEIGGGTGGNPLVVGESTASASNQFSSTATTGLLTFGANSVTYHATVTDTAGTHSVMVSGTATCGT
ncbi:MAG TPA: hypothetical protein VH498_00315 [Candidatus Dormibacteraeota bacterium]|jgi:hypothetical protein|nr:hypothetical protein [Candidatus Dormibacteraeota bacterium]